MSWLLAIGAGAVIGAFLTSIFYDYTKYGVRFAVVCTDGRILSLHMNFEEARSAKQWRSEPCEILEVFVRGVDS